MKKLSFKLHDILKTRFTVDAQGKLPKISLREKDIPYLEGIYDTIHTKIRKKRRDYFEKFDDEKCLREIEEFIELINKHKILNIYIE